MKKILLTLFSTFALLNYASAQVSIYTFAQSSGTYTPFTGGTSVISDTADDNVFGALPIGFSFNYNNTAYTSFGLSVNGWICMGATPTGTNYTPISSGTTNNIISALAKDLELGYTTSGSYTIGSNIITMGAGTTTGFVVGDSLIRHDGFSVGTMITAVGATTITVSNNATAAGTAGTFTVSGNIRYQTTGTSPNRICTVQWTRARRFNNSSTGGKINFFNFQIQLFETTNVVKIVYGPFQTNTTTSVYQVGLRGSATTDFNNRKTSTDWSATAAGTLNTDTCSLRTTIKPASGQTYTWTPPSACTGTPTAGTASAPAGACSGIAFNLTLAGYTNTTSGITFQWQSSTTSGGTYANITGGTTPVFSTTQTTADRKSVV